MFGDTTTMLTLMVFLATAVLAFRGHGDGARARRGQAPRRRASMRSWRRRRTSSARCGTRASRPRNAASIMRPEALCRRRHQGHEGAAQAADPRRHLRSARRRVISSWRAPRSRSGSRSRRSSFAPGQGSPRSFWMIVGAAGIVRLCRRPASISTAGSRARRDEHRSGFPDFMDLLVVCADAGLSMEAALDRVGRELGDSYPSLSANIHMANLEIRAGRTMTEALEHLGDRLGPRGSALVRDADPAIRRARLQHHRGVARLFRRHAPQAALARRREGLQPAGQAFAADDDLHLSRCCSS